MPLANWEVDLNVNGPLTVRGVIRLREPKGFSLPNPFQSDVHIKPANTGVQITATAYASNIENARKVTLVFIGVMLDALTLRLDLPLYLSYAPTQGVHRNIYSEKRVLVEQDWHDAFYEARLLSLAEPTFLRALGWYRKGLCTDDALDSFLAYWNAIEIVAGKYHPDNEEARRGSKSQIWECFKQVWGECDHWPVIPGQGQWIDDNYNNRIAIAHGTQAINLDFIEQTILRLPIIREVSHLFLDTWRENALDPRVPPEQQHQFGY